MAASADRLRDHWERPRGWRAGRREYTFHLTFDPGSVEGGPALHRLAAAFQSALSALPVLDAVPLEWLHLTVQRVGFADDVGGEDVQAVAAAAAARCAGLSPFDLTFSTATVWSEAVVLLPSPVEPVRQLREAVRQAMSDTGVGGPALAVPEHPGGFVPHVSVAYCNADAPAAQAAEAVDRAVLEPAEVRVLAASLLVLGREDHVYRWTTRDSLRLGPASDG